MASRPLQPEGARKRLNLVPSIYLKQGISNSFDASRMDDDSIRVRVDMPGVSPERLRIRAENNRVHFSGSEDPERVHGIQRKHEDMPRTYSGLFDLDPFRFRAGDYVSHLANGVLYLLFKCFCPEPVVLRHHAFALEIGNGENIDGNMEIYNQFVAKGEDRAHTLDCRDEVFVLVVDMPGVSNGNHTLTVEGNKISFRAEADLNGLHPFQMEGEPKSTRVYEGSFEIELEAYEAENAKSVVEFGVLWIEVPRRMRHPTSPGSGNLFRKGRICLHLGSRVSLELHA